MHDDMTPPPSSPTAATQAAAATATATATAVSLPNDAVFDILSRTPAKSLCRFLCVSTGWRDLISDPTFLAEHKSRHPAQDPFLVDTGSFQEGPVESRDLRLMDMGGNLIRVIKGAGGSGMLCSTSLDDLICVNGGPSDGAHVVDPATGEMLVSCPQLEVRKIDAFPGLLTRCYTTFGFGRAAPSGAYKMVRIAEARSCEILTLGVDHAVAGWRQAQAPPIAMDFNHCVPYCRGSPISINGIMYLLASTTESDGTLACLDLESEQWREKVMERPWNEDESGRRTIAARITELNGTLCMVQSVLDRRYHNPRVAIDDPCVNIWLLVDPDNGVWIKAYTIPVALPYVGRYMPLREIAGGKLLLHCSLEDEDSRRRSVLVLQVYDPCTGKCTDVTGTPPANLDGRIGLCSLHLEQLVTVKNRRRRL